MRRLATQSRRGTVKSRRDYQSLVDLDLPLQLKAAAGSSCRLLVSYCLAAEDGAIAGVGGYIHAAEDATISLRVLVAGSREVFSQAIAAGSNYYWTRFGGAWAVSEDGPAQLVIEICWASAAPVLLWGLNCGRVSLPEAVSRQLSDNANLAGVLQSPSICPECLYLSHDSALCGGEITTQSTVAISRAARPNPGKKCSQCQRVLPIDPRLESYRGTQAATKRAPRNMILAFHGHRSKRTGYQNECRACKNVEINGHFNVIRTPDQFHESSTLTRERKLLLRESQILQEFKNRHHKVGLRSFVWERFGRRCFRCHTLVSLQDYELDHTRPLAYLWPLDKHATCLCQPCNNAKKDEFPVIFYSPDQLRELARIVRLPEEVLRQRGVNQVELQRIRADLVRFAESWDPRLFRSVADRVLEYLPRTDLFAELQTISATTHRKLTRLLARRPAAIVPPVAGSLG